LEKAIASMLEQHKLDGDEEIGLDGKSWQPLASVPGLAMYTSGAAARIPAGAGGVDGGIDLPAPKGATPRPQPPSMPPLSEDVVDLPGLRNLEIADLPAPKGAVARPAAQGFDLQGFDQLPSSGGVGELDLGADLPAPKGYTPPPPAGGLGLQDLVDLPAPKPGIVDLPAPKAMRPPPSRPAAPPPVPKRGGGLEYGQIELGGDDTPDLLEPKGAPGGGLDLADGGVPDLVAPKRGTGASPPPPGITDLLTPKEYGTEDGVELDDLPVPAGRSVGLDVASEVGLPAPKRPAGAGPGADVPDLLQPKSSLAPVVDVVAPKEQPVVGEEAEVVRFAPPAREAGVVVPTYEEVAPVDEEIPEAAPKPRPKTKLWIGAGAGIFVLVIGIVLGLVTDLGFFGIGFFTGSYATAAKGKSQLASGQQALLADTYQGYVRAANDLELATKNLPDQPSPLGLQIQARAALIYRFGPDPAQRAQTESLVPKLSKEKDAPPHQIKAHALAALAFGAPQDAVARLKPLSDREPSDGQTGLYLGWAYLAQKDARAALGVFARANAAAPSHPGVYYGVAQAHLALKDTRAAELALDKAISSSGNRHPSSMLLKAKLLLDAGKVKPAGTLLGLVAALREESAPPERGLTEALLGEVARREGQIDDARKRFETAVRIDPQGPLGHLGLGELLYGARHYTDALLRFKKAQALDPTSIRAAAMVAQTVIEVGKPLEARKALETIMATAPESPEVLYLQGLVDAAVANYSSAERFFREALKKNPTHFLAYLNLSRIYLKQNREHEAHTVLQQADAKIPISPLVRNAQGEAYYATKKLDKARTKFEEALKLDPTHNDALYNLGKTLADLDKLDEARTRLVQLKGRDKSYPNLSARLGNVYMRQKEYAKAAAEYDEALKVENPPEETRVGAARSYILAGKPEKALKQCAAVLDANPTVPLARALRAEALLQQKKYDEARSEIGQAVEREKNADFYVVLGQIEEARGKVADAVDAYAEALALDATRTEIRARRAILLVKNGAVQDGLTELKKVIKNNPNMAEAYMYMGDAHRELQQEDAALRSYATAVGKDPKLAEAHYKLGSIYADRQNKATAISHLQLATQHAKPADPWLALAYYDLGSAALDRGQKKVAIDALTKYLEIAPPKAAARPEAERKLKSLGVTPKTEK
jgi:tetratricopeptide (TPR) repeat protein